MKSIALARGHFYACCIIMSNVVLLKTFGNLIKLLLQMLFTEVTSLSYILDWRTQILQMHYRKCIFNAKYLETYIRVLGQILSCFCNVLLYTSYCYLLLNNNFEKNNMKFTSWQCNITAPPTPLPHPPPPPPPPRPPHPLSVFPCALPVCNVISSLPPLYLMSLTIVMG